MVCQKNSTLHQSVILMLWVTVEYIAKNVSARTTIVSNLRWRLSRPQSHDRHSTIILFLHYDTNTNYNADTITSIISQSWPISSTSKSDHRLVHKWTDSWTSTDKSWSCYSHNITPDTWTASTMPSLGHGDNPWIIELH